MATDYPDDLDGEVLRMIAEDGHDMTQPMDVEFHVAAATEEVAEKIAEAAVELGYEAFIDFDDGSDDEEVEDEITEPWTCTCRKAMVLEYDAIMASQSELDAIARPMGGYADGWGTFGNVEVEGEDDDDIDDEDDIDEDE
jgi:regulator of RNase E activity RraB